MQRVQFFCCSIYLRSVQTSPYYMQIHKNATHTNILQRQHKGVASSNHIISILNTFIRFFKAQRGYLYETWTFNVVRSVEVKHDWIVIITFSIYIVYFLILDTTFPYEGLQQNSVFIVTFCKAKSSSFGIYNLLITLIISK